MYEIVAIRLVSSDDGTHSHLELVGYASSHMPGEAIMIPPARVLQRQAMGEKFWVDVNGEKTDVTAGACSTCGFEPQLKPDALLELPEK